MRGRPRLKGGTTGPALIPGNPKESLLVDAINYGETYQMPPKSKLPPRRDRHFDRLGREGCSMGHRHGRLRRITGHPQDSGYPLEVRIRHPRSLLELPTPQARFAAVREAGTLRLGTQPD